MSFYAASNNDILLLKKKMNHKSIQTTNIYANILDSTMDTYANIINNNMSSVMKMLTSISIILMFPTLIASLFGMNLINGMENSAWGFPLALFLSIGVTVLFMWYFKRKTWI